MNILTVEKDKADHLQKAEFFKKMYSAHETIKGIKEKIDKLYLSATYISPTFDGTPKSTGYSNKIENTIVELTDLKSYAENLLKARARFDLFVCTLDPTESTVLSLRYEYPHTWKEISSCTKLSVTTLKDLLRQIETKADNFDFTCANSDEIAQK